MRESDSLIQIKGIRDGLLVTLGDAAWDELLIALIGHIDERRVFFQGAKLVLDVRSQILHVTEMANLRDLLSERGISLWAVISSSPATEKTAQLLGLATRISKPRPEDIQHATKQTLLDDAALWLNRTIRSGTRTEFHGHIAVLGDVNHGAEIVADGSIIIWGRLRGVIHAGAQGDQKASVCALDFAPTQLRIAGEIAGLPLKVDQKQPSKAILRDGHIIVIPWKSGQQ